MNTRERFQAVMNFQPFDRLPVIEWAIWWDKTIERWHSEGLPASITDRYDLFDHFGLECYWEDWIWPQRPSCPQPAVHLGPVIGSMSDYEKILPHLYPSVKDLSDHWRAWEECLARRNRDDMVMWFALNGFFWFPRDLLGAEPHLYAFYDQPDLLHRMCEDLAQWQISIIEHVCTIAQPDFMVFAEDMSYNNGPMLSEELFREFLQPYYEQVIPLLHQHGIQAIVDSDGDITTPAHWFESAGIDGILPLERQAGVDIARLRAAHPRMKFIGHFDKMVMNKGEAAMRAEFERLLPTAAKGGFIIGCDHQTPPGVCYSDYQLYLSLFREYAAEAGRLSRAFNRS